MKWNEIEGLSQEGMEEWFRVMLNPASAIQQKGVIPRMEPHFIGCDFEKGTAELAFTVKEWELNPQDMIHGGITNTVFDTSIGLLSHYYTQPNLLTTVVLTTSFIKPILLGDTFHVYSQLENLGGTLVSGRGEIRLERDNILAATATATFKIMHKKAEYLDNEELKHESK